MTPPPAAYEAAAELIDELSSGPEAYALKKALSDVIDAAERHIRARVAAEYTPAMQTSRHQWWIHECGHVEPVVGPVFASDGCDACETVTGDWRPLFARIAEGTP